MDHAHHPHGIGSRLKSRLIWLGVALTGLGILAIAVPWAAATFVDFMVAGSLLAAGVTQLGAAASTYSWRGFWLTVLCGGLSLVAGTAMLAIPAEGVHAMTTFMPSSDPGSGSANGSADRGRRAYRPDAGGPPLPATGDMSRKLRSIMPMPTATMLRRTQDADTRPARRPSRRSRRNAFRP